MPRADRLVELTNLLAGRRRRSMRELVRHFEVSERTLYRDLRDLARWCPITRFGNTYGLVEGAHLPPLNLTAEEHALLRLALGMPVLRKSPALARRLATLEAKLEAVTSRALESPEALALATLDRSGPIDPALLERLEKAAGERCALEILYTSMTDGAARWRRIDPYHLFHRADAWYLVGRCHVHDEPRTFRLDRIRQARTLPARFTVPADFSLERYLTDTWAIMRGARPIAVVLRFDPALAPLLQRARHHASEQMQSVVGGEIEYRATVSHLDEIARWVVGFGGRCRVVKPEALRKKVVALADGAARAQEESRPAPRKGRRRKRPGRGG